MNFYHYVFSAQTWENLTANVPPLLVSCELRNELFSVKDKNSCETWRWIYYKIRNCEKRLLTHVFHINLITQSNQFPFRVSISDSAFNLLLTFWEKFPRKHFQTSIFRFDFPPTLSNFYFGFLFRATFSTCTFPLKFSFWINIFKCFLENKNLNSLLNFCRKTQREKCGLTFRRFSSVAKFGTLYFLLKIKILAKRERELTTKFAIARNGCYRLLKFMPTRTHQLSVFY